MMTELFIITYFKKSTDVDGFLVVRGRTWQDIKNKVREKFGDTIQMTGILRCEDIKKDIYEQILYDFNKGR